jgi:hypothetical protein
VIEHAKTLYALSPSEFIAARNQLAKSLKADGRVDEAAFVSGLRRPKLAEHALNRVANDDHALVERAVTAASRAADAQSAAIGGAATSLREATAELRAATKDVVDAAVAALDAQGASGEGQRDEIGDLLRGLLTSPSGSTQLMHGVVGFEGVELSDEMFPGAPEPRSESRRAGAKKAPPAKAASKAPPGKPATPKRAEARDGERDTARVRHQQLQDERNRLAKRRREAQKAADDAERDVAKAVKEVERAQRHLAAMQETLAAAEETVQAADEALERFERSLRD